MRTNYIERLNIPIAGRLFFKFYSENKEQIADGYERIVIGARGPYIEFTSSQIIMENIFIPKDQEWRLELINNAYYVEYRTKVDLVKIYYQLKTVDYADYKVGFWYISPFDLRDEYNRYIIKPLNSGLIISNKKHNFKDLEK